MDTKLVKDSLYNYAGKQYLVINILPFDTNSFYYKLEELEFHSIIYLLL